MRWNMPDGESFNTRVIAASDQEALERMRHELLTCKPGTDPNIALISRIIKRYVGSGLKWIILRDRLQHATLLADTVERSNRTSIA